ncbi:MAG: PAS domain S-box protein [Proteobacteria bacterium]|nr:PAS domain S-box protein [Pseudomonadota bacterium]
MNDMRKTKAQLIEELVEQRERIVRIESTGSKPPRPDRQLLIALVDQMLEPTVILDFEGTLLHGNFLAAQMIGLDSAGEITGMSLTSIMHPDSLEQAALDLQAVKASEADFSSTYKLLVDGRTVHIESHGTKIELSDGPVDLVSFRDATARLKSEQQLREAYAELERRVDERTAELLAEKEALKQSESKFRGLAESTTAHISIIQDDCYVYANQAFLDYFELDSEDLILLSPEDMAMGMMGQEEIERAASGWRAAMERGDARFRFEFQDLEGRWFQTNVTMMELDGKESFLAMNFDITEHKRDQEALAKSEDKYRAIFETTGTGTIIFDNDAVISLANDEWASLTGYSREEIEGKMTWMLFFSAESLERMKRYHEKRSQDPSSVPRAYEAQLVDRQGKQHDGIITIAMVPGTTQRVGSFQDLTALKRAQKEMYRADKMAALGQIIAGVAHEINNPNNFIFFNLPILRRYVEAMSPLLESHLVDDPNLKILNMPFRDFLADAYKLLENMEHGSQRITGIVSELKNYIRSDEEQIKKVEHLPDVIERVMTLVGKQVRKTVKRFDVEVADDLPPLTMNTGKIEQVLINLVINAGQAADKDDSWVELKARRSDDSGFVEILVEDNGAGIPAENLDQVFEPFFTSKSREIGTGLGLSISHRIVEEHGGTIEVDSTVGEGTLFTIRLPVADA